MGKVTPTTSDPTPQIGKGVISFKCAKCRKVHTAREKAAGRRGFCSCGAVMVVPGINDIAADFTPKLIGDLDFNAGKRRAIYGMVAGVVAAVILVYFAFFYNAWERGNKPQLLAMAYQAEQSLSSGKRAEAIDQYEKFVDAIGSHELSDSVLISKFQAAQSAISSWRDDQQEAARKLAEAKRTPPQTYYAGGTSDLTPSQQIDAIEAGAKRRIANGESDASDLQARIDVIRDQVRSNIDAGNRQTEQPGYTLEQRRQAAIMTLEQQGHSAEDARSIEQSMEDQGLLPDPPRR